MDDETKKLEILKHAREIYLTHLRERWALIHFMIIVYSAIFGWFAYTLFQKKGAIDASTSTIIITFFSILLCFTTLIIQKLSDRISFLIAVQRDFVIKKIEADIDSNKSIGKDPGCYQPVAREGFFTKYYELYRRKFIDKHLKVPSIDKLAHTDVTGDVLKKVFNIMYFISAIGFMWMLIYVISKKDLVFNCVNSFIEDFRGGY